MKIRKNKTCMVLEIETTNDAFTCGVIASKQKGVTVDMADYGCKGIRIVDGVLLNALCGDGVYLAKGQVANSIIGGNRPPIEQKQREEVK